MDETQKTRNSLPRHFPHALPLFALFILVSFVFSCATAPTTREETAAAVAPTPADSGAPVDSGTPADSGAPVDSGVPVDSGAPADSGTPVDSGALVALPEEVSLRLLPEEGPEFWETMMTREVAYQYRAINGVSQCTIFVADVLKAHFGIDAYSQVFPSGVKGSNETFLDWVENQSLVRLFPEEYSISDIQDLANQGYLILMAYYYPEISGHVAFVGNGTLKLFTIPPIDGLEGKNGGNLDRSWLPVMVQAGTYTGITSMVYATNNWLRIDNYGEGTVRYYFVKDGRDRSTQP